MTRVCLDARSLTLTQGTGVSTYAAMLVHSLALAGDAVELLSDVPAGAARPVPGGRARRWASAAWPLPRAAPAAAQPGGARHAPTLRHVADAYRTAQVHFDIYRRFLAVRDDDPPDLMHWTYPLPLRFAGVPNVYTVHDLIPLLHPALTPIAPARLRRILHRIGQGASHVVTVSESARQDILATMGWHPDRVTNTYQAVDIPPEALASPEDAAAAAQRLTGAGWGGYVLHVGSIEPRKNLARLIEAYAASQVPAPLVLAGPDGWHADAELQGGRELLRATGPGPRIVRLPWLDRRDLVSLMRGARAVLLPSLAEGFGLPITEAMLLGTPVLTSAGGATAEVAGGAALLVDPHDAGSMAQGLVALDRDAPLRTALVRRGRGRAALFTPAAYAARLQTAYRHALAAPHPGISAAGCL